jgi:NAD-dependent dihydropyrimidine dehydrogenase PreA subunit
MRRAKGNSIMPLLVCRCAHRDIIPDAALADAPKRSGVCVVDDLCATVQAGGAGLAEFAATGGRVAACHPRAVRGLFAAVGLELPEERVVDLRAGDPLPELTDAERTKMVDIASPEDEDAWFPVIDRDRCTNCGRCADFCLFGVYLREEDRTVRVARPERCKLDCPACARICPVNAIIFPKSPDEAINGARLSKEQLAGARIRLSPEELTGGNLKTQLANRRKKRRLLRPDALGEEQ